MAGGGLKEVLKKPSTADASKHNLRWQFSRNAWNMGGAQLADKSTDGKMGVILQY
jgi:hypothetical protein